MNAISFISDNWQYRFNRYISTLPEDDPLREVNENIWKSFKEEHRSIILPAEDNQPLEIEVFSVQQDPMHTESIYEWQPHAGTYCHAHRLLASHASLRTAMAGAKFDKIIGVSKVNFRELTRNQLDHLCREIADWWDQSERTFVSPYSRMASIMHNWLQGVYGEAPTNVHPSLDAIRDIANDQRQLLIHTTRAMLKVLEKTEMISSEAEIAVVGQGLWSESLAVELGLDGWKCHQFSTLQQELPEVVLLASQFQVVEPVSNLNCKLAIELLPNQIHPDADQVLFDNDVKVIPDIICTSSKEIVENWWICGKPVSTMEHAIYLSFTEIFEKLLNEMKKDSCGGHDAAIGMVLKKLSKLWT